MSEKIYTIEEIKIILYNLLKDTMVQNVTLFGSYAKNKATKDSDLDLIIDTNGKLIGLSLYDLIAQIEEKFKKNVDAFETMELAPNSKIKEEVEKTGVVVYEK